MGDSYTGEVQRKLFSIINEDTAVTFALQASKWLQERLGIDTSDFFRVVDVDSLTGEPLNVYSFRPTNSEIHPDNNHFWVYESPQTEIILDHLQPFTYFDNYSEALDKHIKNLVAGKDSYVRGASGASANSNIIRRALFEVHFAYGIMVVLHEPYHPWVSNLLAKNILNDMYIVNEALTSFLGFESLRIFSKESMSDPKLIHAIDTIIDQTYQSTEFSRLAYFLLKRKYTEMPQQEILRDTEAEALLSEIREYSSRRDVNPDMETIRINEFNNARVIASLHYSGTLLVRDYFQTNCLDTVEFILNEELQGKHIQKIFDYVRTNFYKEPTNLDEVWENMKQKIDASEDFKYIYKD